MYIIECLTLNSGLGALGGNPVMHLSVSQSGGVGLLVFASFHSGKLIFEHFLLSEVSVRMESRNAFC